MAMRFDDPLAVAALSEHDEYACLHGDTWYLFHSRFVASGAFDWSMISGLPVISTALSAAASATAKQSTTDIG